MASLDPVADGTGPDNRVAIDKEDVAGEDHTISWDWRAHRRGYGPGQLRSGGVLFPTRRSRYPVESHGRHRDLMPLKSKGLAKISAKNSPVSPFAGRIGLKSGKALEPPFVHFFGAGIGADNFGAGDEWLPKYDRHWNEY